LNTEIQSLDICDSFEGLNVLMFAAFEIAVGPFEKTGGNAFNHFASTDGIVSFLDSFFALFQVQKSF